MTKATRRLGTGIALATLAMLLATFGLLLPHPAGAQGWLDDTWSYRRPVSVANPGAAPLADYQVRITLDASFDYAHARSDGSDLRVTDSDGTTLLPYWTERWDPSGLQALLWVRVPAIAAGGTTLYLYYGNVAAGPASNGSTTFPLFDDSLWTTASTGNPVQTAGQSWWEANLTYPIVFEDASFPDRPRFHMLYDGHNRIGHAKGYATSADLVHWIEYDNGLAGSERINPIMGTGYTGNAPFAWGDVIERDGVYHMFPSRGPGQTVHTQSTDLIHWTGFETLAGYGTGVAVLKEPDGITPVVVDGKYWMVYFPGSGPGSMYLASTDATGDLLTWTSYGVVLAPTPGAWDASGLWTPSFTKVGESYYIYYEGNGAGGWVLGYAKGAAVSGGNPVRPDETTWSKSASPVVTPTHGWDTGGCTDPVLRVFDGTCYLFYTSNGAYTNGFCTSTSPEGPWTQYGGAGPGVGWAKGGAPAVTDGILTLGSGSYVRSPVTYSPGVALGFRARFDNSPGTAKFAGFMNATAFPGLLVEASTFNATYALHLVAYAAPTFYTASLGAPPGEFHVYEDAWVSASLGRVFVDNATTPNGSITVAAAVPDGPLPVEFYNYNDGGHTLAVDWMYLRKYAEPEPASSLGTEQVLAVGDPPPVRTRLAPAMPTPFGPRTTLEFSLAVPGVVGLEVFGVDGRRVRTLFRGAREAGVHRLAWDGRDDEGRELPAGIYFARLVAGHERFTRTLVRLTH